MLLPYLGWADICSLLPRNRITQHTGILSSNCQKYRCPEESQMSAIIHIICTIYMTWYNRRCCFSLMNIGKLPLKADLFIIINLFCERVSCISDWPQIMEPRMALDSWSSGLHPLSVKITEPHLAFVFCPVLPSFSFSSPQLSHKTFKMYLYYYWIYYHLWLSEELTFQTW